MFVKYMVLMYSLQKSHVSRNEERRYTPLQVIISRTDYYRGHQLRLPELVQQAVDVGGSVHATVNTLGHTPLIMLMKKVCTIWHAIVLVSFITFTIYYKLQIPKKP